MDDEVVGMGVIWSSKQVVSGAMAYERVKAVVFMNEKPLLSTEDFEKWVSHETIPQEVRPVARRFWEDSKVIQPYIWNPHYNPPWGQRCWVPWSKLEGK